MGHEPVSMVALGLYDGNQPFHGSNPSLATLLRTFVITSTLIPSSVQLASINPSHNSYMPFQKYMYRAAYSGADLGEILCILSIELRFRGSAVLSAMPSHHSCRHSTSPLPSWSLSP